MPRLLGKAENSSVSAAAQRSFSPGGVAVPVLIGLLVLFGVASSLSRGELPPVFFQSALAADAEPIRPNDPFFRSTGTWGQSFADQWGLHRIGFAPPGSAGTAWDVELPSKTPVIVAVIDTGLDYFHPDLKPENIWRNPKEQPNGVDDDGNGYIDDLIGWNFVDRNNNPWDHAGHGTHVSGIIAAATDNGEGVAGINARAQLMPLKVLNFLGRGRSTGIAEAVFYAVRQGARVINLSLGGHAISQVEQLAIDYAYEKGVLVVVASGNVAEQTADYGMAASKSVIAVAATGPDDKRAEFSNWGRSVKIAAPGVDILSLRARRTDFVLVSEAEDYRAGEAFVGPGARYYRASGTSFAAPFVAGVASLLLARNPKLTNVQVERMLLESADDVEEPGWDHFTGAGRLNAVAALKADPHYFLTVKVSQVAPVKVDGKTAIQVSGTAVGSQLKSYELQLGQGDKPASWKTVAKVDGKPVDDGVLGTFPVKDITAKGKWLVRVVAQDGKKTKEARGTLDVK
ncbi:S8 family peptidase [Nitrospira moscoviensis]|uniref:Peptidase S8 and S53 subtilisin kexin sedolisin n=1 Tax=Nitrospira moscoviensis TaxID=42253 RepID=A0A0K2GI25_NITMO|nr:S8 family peptidase [Nitrospira moscoviensis]ALA60504.1 Peptidase S8 and S53 subtilisin kexin sedolisin [Nitrospira moscoviensis]